MKPENILGRRIDAFIPPHEKKLVLSWVNSFINLGEKIGDGEVGYSWDQQTNIIQSINLGFGDPLSRDEPSNGFFSSSNGIRGRKSVISFFFRDMRAYIYSAGNEVAVVANGVEKFYVDDRRNLHIVGSRRTIDSTLAPTVGLTDFRMGKSGLNKIALLREDSKLIWDLKFEEMRKYRQELEKLSEEERENMPVPLKSEFGYYGEAVNDLYKNSHKKSREFHLSLAHVGILERRVNGWRVISSLPESEVFLEVGDDLSITYGVNLFGKGAQLKDDFERCLEERFRDLVGLNGRGKCLYQGHRAYTSETGLIP